MMMDRIGIMRVAAAAAAAAVGRRP